MYANDDHPLRYALTNELHARPSPRLDVPGHVVYLAFKEPLDAAGRDKARDLDHLGKLTQRHGAPAPSREAGHYSAAVGTFDLRWEQHTEFVTYTAYSNRLPDRPFDPADAAIFPASWQSEAPGKRIVASLIRIEEMPDSDAEIESHLTEWFARDSLAAVQVLDGSAVIASDFRIDPAGWSRMVVFVRKDIGPGRVGRIIQRLLEIETYRTMSMLGLMRARELSRDLNRLDPKLSALSARMGENNEPPEDMLHQLLDVSGELERLATFHAFRFGATEAYEAIVMDRIEALRETRFRGRQTLTEFMRRRYAPAMRTVTASGRRLTDLRDRAARISETLRTRVDVDRSAQNQKLLQSMDQRADLQLRLQHTVEGLSVVAISYYALGLASYALSPLAKLVGMDKTVLTALLVPLVIGGVWLALRRIKARIGPMEH